MCGLINRAEFKRQILKSIKVLQISKQPLTEITIKTCAFEEMI